MWKKEMEVQVKKLQSTKMIIHLGTMNFLVALKLISRTRLFSQQTKQIKYKNDHWKINKII